MSPVSYNLCARKQKIHNGVKVNIINLQKNIVISRFVCAKIKKAVFETIFSQSQKKNVEINICLCTGKRIKGFNKRYLAQDAPTDVIAFNTTASDNRNILTADIIISAEAAVSNAKIFKTAPLYELFLYVIHGMLHILGDDDNTEKKRIKMNKKQELLCRKIFKAPAAH